MFSTTCTHVLRTGPCALSAGHRGRHSTVGFYCDGCGQTRRGAPHAADADVALCFKCCVIDADAAREAQFQAEMEASRELAAVGW